MKKETTKPGDRQVGGDHYLGMGIDPWTVFEKRYEPEEFAAYLHQTAIAYLLRSGTKGDDPVQEIRKAIHCLEKEAEVLECSTS